MTSATMDQVAYEAYCILPALGTTVVTPSVCHVDMVAGGLNGILGLSESDIHAPANFVGGAVLTPHVLHPVVDRSADASHAFVKLASQASTVQKYILTASLLI